MIFVPVQVCFSTTAEVIINYEFIEYLRELFLQMEYVDVGEKEELDTVVLEVVEFVMYHEIGHAIIDILELPVTGKEEDAVDALAAVILIEFFEEGADM